MEKVFERDNDIERPGDIWVTYLYIDMYILYVLPTKELW